MPMNKAVTQMFRSRRQSQGKRQEQRNIPATQGEQVRGARMDVSAEHMPLTFSWVTRDWGTGDSGEQQQRTNYFIPPAFDPNELVELPTSYKPDSELDPLPTSDLFAEGLKIRPWAHFRPASYLAMEEWLGGADDEFKAGKGQFRHHVPQYVGRQNPIDISPLIPEADYTSYGALTMLSPADTEAYPVGDGYLFD